MLRNSRDRIQKPVGPCYFCKEKVEPDYKDPKILGKYTTSRAKIVARNRSGLCQKHQRKVTIAIKRARYLALMPFETRLR